MPHIHSLCFAEVIHTLIQTNSQQKTGGHARLSCPPRHVELHTTVLNTQLQVATKGYGNRTVFHQPVCE
jgi:hypothetical protein